ncbi:hypothetical protein N0B44_33610 [Roseibacterium beibuensis]|uniref:hypothetical protein n=1 Tax=[Roseibacterium] beibuensis TaxID=1193142 RepID=UPI00217EF824|nr:hypothetical protein [Roseibacterium beibuensis]MCS6627850.1 hypothetical protein [Roseibacterium beibuensis]
MSPRRIRVERLIAVLGAAVLLLGAVLLFLVTRAGGLGGGEPSVEDRARAQLRAHIGRDAVVRYTETGRRRAVCGYVTDQEGELVVFISRPNRILLETDPLKAEFDEMLRDLCPGFLTRPPNAIAAGGRR